MLKRAFVLATALALASGPALARPGQGPPDRGPDGGPPTVADRGDAQGPKGGVVKVGAAARSVLPTVDGSHDYLDGLEPDPADPLSPGLPVPAFDQGRVPVGNGASDAKWVHDDMEVTAVAFEDLRTEELTVVVAANLYMVLGPDAAEIRERVAERLGPDLAARTQVAIHADHNHHGPDTAFDVNHEWYELFIDQAVDAVVEAVDVRRPARLEVAETEHHFGVRDSRDPRVTDPTLGVLKATATSGDTIATLLFWSNHPEVTLFWEGPSAEYLADDCELLGLGGDDCTAEDAVFTADFPGWATRILEDELGGHAAYVNGAVGNLITPLGAQVWEVDDQHPVGNGLVAPDGAEPPLGASNYTERNFRRTYLVGRELAHAALDALEDAEVIRRPDVSYEVQPVFTRMSNIGFRFLLVPGDDGFTSLGHLPGPMYTCPATGEKSAATCTDVGLATQSDDLLGTVRVGDHVRTQVARLQIGPVDTMWIPAEIGPESTIGLPAGYLDTPELWHGDDPELHAFGEAYDTGGYVTNRMDGEYRWIVGLGNDELGYAVPLSDYRVYCVADDLAGPGTCQALYEAGAIEYPDAVAGATCKAITEDPSLLAAYGPAAEAVAGSCRYGQALDEAQDHYEETNSAGWDLHADILDAVAALTGNASTDTVNPDLPGYWWDGAQGFLP